MQLRNAIGIDPDSKGIICSYVKSNIEKPEKKGFLATKNGLNEFVRWLGKHKNIIIAIEGQNGQSKPVEKILRKNGIIFYSFKPYDVDKFRKAVLGQNKNNHKDAESVARYAMALEAQGKLENYKRVWFPDEELQILTRSHEEKTKELTREINRLWKLIRMASVDLYLALGGKNPDISLNGNKIKNVGILTLLSKIPDIQLWKDLSENDILNIMDGNRYKGRMDLISELKKISVNFEPISLSLSLLIKNAAIQIINLTSQKKDLENLIKQVTKDIKAVKILEEIKGISIITASKMIAEIINIKRFAKNDNLASYAGLCLKENKTGESEKMKYSKMFNHRLKDTFMVAAKNFVMFNPDSHLSGYYRNLIKSRVKKTEVRKRVARALVRVIFRKLNAISLDIAPNIQQDRSENEMASGSSHEDHNNPGNISLSTPLNIQTNIDNKGKEKKEVLVEIC